MKIKRFHAQDMSAALVRVREELGEDAVIISTRTLGSTPADRRRGLRGVEVVAGVDERPGGSAVQQALSVAAVRAAGQEPPAVMPAAVRTAYAREIAAARAAISTEPASPRSAPIVSAPSFPRLSRDGANGEGDDLDALLPFAEALAAARGRYSTDAGDRAADPVENPAAAVPRAAAERPVSLRQGEPVSGPVSAVDVPVPSYVPPLPASPPSAVPEARPSPALAAAERAFDLLLQAGLGERAAETALEEAIRILPPAALAVPERLIEVGLARLVALLPGGPSLTAESLAGKAVLFIGPAGVGKTTALLKAALHLRRTGADVSICGADVSRIGASEQLVRYGEVLRLPVRIVYDSEELSSLLAEVPPGRITLVDTAPTGRHLGPEGLSDELRALLAAAPGGIVVLTVPASTTDSDLRQLSAVARAAGVSTAAITRTDEVSPGAGSGAALNVLVQLGLPVLLCSAGRDVLAGLSRMTAAALAAQTLEALMGKEEATAA